MIDQAARTALLGQFEVILREHETDRVYAGLATVQAMREAGATCWTDLFPVLAAWRGHHGYAAPRPPGATQAERVVRIVAPRLDDVPPADLAELALLAAAPQTMQAYNRATAIAMPWNERRNVEFKCEHDALVVWAQKLASLVGGGS
jgi:hypothetical protein